MERPPNIIDQLAWRRARRRRPPLSAKPYQAVINHVSAEMTERLSTVTRTFELAVDIGSPEPDFAAAAQEAGVQKVVRLASMADDETGVPTSTEQLPLAEASIDLAISIGALQHVDDVHGVLLQIRRALKPDGWLLAAVAGADTLIELRQSLLDAEAQITGGASPRVLPFMDVQTAAGLLQRAGFALPVVDRERVTVRYAGLDEIAADLRASGMTNVLADRSRRPLARSVWALAEQIYRQRFGAEDERLPATLDLIWLSGWAPAPSQQKPLAPGSAQTRLADALGTTERKAGEKAGPDD